MQQYPIHRGAIIREIEEKNRRLDECLQQLEKQKAIVYKFEQLCDLEHITNKITQNEQDETLMRAYIIDYQKTCFTECMNEFQKFLWKDAMAWQEECEDTENDIIFLLASNQVLYDLSHVVKQN